MACDRIRPQLTAYLDGELDGDRGTVVRGHLRGCAACRAIASDEATLRDGLRALPSVDPPPQLWAAVQARLAQEEVADAARPRWRQVLARWRHVVPSARLATSGVLVVGVATALVWWRTQRAPDDDAPAAGRAIATTRVPSPVIGGAGAPTEPVALAPPHVDVTEDLARDAERASAAYASAIDELLAATADTRATWSEDRRRAFDGKLKTLRAAIVRADEGRPRHRASRALLRYLQGAVIREDVLLAGVTP